MKLVFRISEDGSICISLAYLLYDIDTSKAAMLVALIYNFVQVWLREDETSSKTVTKR